MRKLFSKRNKPQVGELRYDIPNIVRSRILSVFEDLCNEHNGGFPLLLLEVGKFLFKQYGVLRQSSFAAARHSDDPTIEHFFCCDDEQALDFIEVCFENRLYSGKQEGVEEINEIFMEYGIGYELTPFIENHIEKETTLFGGKRIGTVIEFEYPKIIRKDNQFAHQEIVEPVLSLLSNSRFKVANAEMLKAHTALRMGDYEDAITITGSAFESFLKTILSIKQIDFNPDKETCAKLVKICHDNAIFPSFYSPTFEAVGTIRNKLGDAHGRGPEKAHTASLEHAEHMIRVTSSHMLFIAKLSRI